MSTSPRTEDWLCQTRTRGLRWFARHPRAHLGDLRSDIKPETTGARGAKCEHAKPQAGPRTGFAIAKRREPETSALCSGAPCKYLGDAHPAPDARVGCAHAPDAGGATCAAPNAWEGGAAQRHPIVQNCEIRTAPVWAGGECGRRHDAINSNVDIATPQKIGFAKREQEVCDGSHDTRGYIV